MLQRNKQMAVYQHKNKVENVEKIRLNWLSFHKRSQFLTTKISNAYPSVSAASNSLVFNIPLMRGVRGFQ